MTGSGDSNNLQGVVKRLVGEWDAKPNKGHGIYMADGRAAIDELKKIERGMQFRILFLLIHGHKGSTGHGNNYRSQKEVKELAAEFGIDYQLIDAEVRLEFCAKKHKESHKIYLEALQKKSKDAKAPKLFPRNGRRMINGHPIVHRKSDRPQKRLLLSPGNPIQKQTTQRRKYGRFQDRLFDRREGL